MDVDVTPEPSEQERAAILAALDAADDADEAKESAWREAGLREATGLDA